VRFPGPTHRVLTCESAAEARAAVAAALRILNELGVQLHPQKTRIVHVRQGFEFRTFGRRTVASVRATLCATSDPTPANSHGFPHTVQLIWSAFPTPHAPDMLTV